MCASLEPERLEELYSYSAYTDVSLTGQCPVDMNISVPKIVVFRWAPKHKMTIFWNSD
jgi:hypothetical protein